MNSLSAKNHKGAGNIIIDNFHRSLKPALSADNIKKIIFTVLKNEKCTLYSLFINFVTDRQIRQINKNYLNHDYSTDIIVFAYNPSYESLEAEFIISLDTIRYNATRFGSSLNDELARVIIHGCLHLAGYDDKTRRQKELIRSAENFYLSKICQRINEFNYINDRIK